MEDTRSDVSPNPPVVDEEPGDSFPLEERDDDDNYQNRPHPYCDTAEAEGISCYGSHLFHFSCFRNSLGLRKSWCQCVVD
ncbi:MAG: hypothetical protein GEU26_07625 [Nitrososphaeraceae archaeon]|nr:hypothetical protein [Nitrososphaeraceae archaeon]